MAYTLLDDAPAEAPKAKARFTLIEDDDLTNPTGSFTENVKAGAGKMLTDVARGVGQRVREFIEPTAFVKDESGKIRRKPWGEATGEKTIADYFGLPNGKDAAEARELDKPLMKTGGGLVGNIGMGAAALAPAALIPGANTVTGAGLMGGLLGYTQPTVKGESPLANAVTGEIVGAGIQGAAGKVGSVLKDRAAAKAEEAAAKELQAAPRDAILKAGREAGYVATPTSVDPSLKNQMIESVGGKILTAQTASTKNQTVTNKLAREYLEMPGNSVLSKASIADAKNVASEPYRQVAATSDEAAQALKDWKQANFDAKEWMLAFRKSGNPEAYDRAQAARQASEAALSKIEEQASAVGKPQLVEALKAARVRLGKLSTIDDAMTNSGNVDAAVISRFGDKFPLQGQLKVIADFAGEFPKATALPEKFGGMSHALRPGIGAGVGTLVGGPVGAAVGAAAGTAVPWSARQMMLSNVGQKMLATPSYGSGGQTIAGLMGSPITQAALPPATVGSLLQYRAQQ